MLFWTPRFSVLDSTFFVLDSTFWLDSTLIIDPGRRNVAVLRYQFSVAMQSDGLERAV